MQRDYPAGGYDDWISNLTEQEDRQYLVCHECRNYIVNETYWKINGEVLCDDCAKAKYQFGVEEIYYEDI